MLRLKLDRVIELLLYNLRPKEIASPRRVFLKDVGIIT